MQRSFIRANLLFGMAAAAHGQEPPKAPLTPVVRVTLQLDSTSSAQFDARGFELITTQGPDAASAEVRLVKRAGPHTGVLLSLSNSGARFPGAVINVLDSLGATAVTFRLSDVAVVSERISLSAARAGLEQQRIAQQEAMSSLTTDFQEAQRQLATVEELNKAKSASRSDLARAKERANDLQRRMDLLRQRQALLLRQLDDQGPLDEALVLRFMRLEIDSREVGGKAAIDVTVRPPLN